jgi:hypothetical protein
MAISWRQRLVAWRSSWRVLYDQTPRFDDSWRWADAVKRALTVGWVARPLAFDGGTRLGLACRVATRSLGIAFSPLERRRELIVEFAVLAEQQGYDMVSLGEG